MGIQMENEPPIEFIPLQSLDQPQPLRMENFYAMDQDNSFIPKIHFDVLEKVIRKLIEKSGVRVAVV